MDRVTGIIRYQWRAYWRRFSRARSLTTGNQGITLIIIAVLFFKLVGTLASAAAAISAGDAKLVQLLLTGIFLAWLFLPISTGSSAIPLHGLVHLPLSLKALFAIRISSLLIPPYSWIVIAASLAIGYPLSHAASPVAGMAAALLLIAMSGLLGVTLAHLIGSATWRRLLIVLLLVSVTTGYWLSIENPTRMAQLFSFPVRLVTDAALGRNQALAIGLLMMMNLVSAVTAVWSLRVHLQATTSRTSRRRSSSILFRLPGAVGGFAAKDVRYFRTLLDPYFGVLVAALGCIYLVASDPPSPAIAWVFTLSVFIPNSPLAFNSFGLDTSAALERYALLPATGQTVMRAKNFAFVLLCLLQIAPIICLTFWRLGFSAGMLGLALAASTAAAYLTWGNWMSTSLPSKMHQYRFSPTTGSLPELMAGIFFGSLPGILAVSVLRSDHLHPMWLMAVLLVTFGLLYLLMTARSGRRFDRERERIALSLKLR